VVRTRDRLGDAFIGLVQEKPFEAITVQNVLDRAGVSRSTFYAHYRDTEDLFLSDVDEFLESMANWLSVRSEGSCRVAPVRELFAHVRDQQCLYAALLKSGRIHDFMQLAGEHFARAIERRLRELRPGPKGTDLPAFSHALAGALLSLMSWWLGSQGPGSPEAMDALFHRLVWTGVRLRSLK
jgi:AcrR family transcriptional regulator